MTRQAARTLTTGVAILLLAAAFQPAGAASTCPG